MTAMTPEHAWEIYVGSQSPSEFFKRSDEDKANDAVYKYVADSPTCDELSDEEKEDVVNLLLDHLRSSLGLDI